MLTKQQIKLIRSLHEKKYRSEEGLFLVEGTKDIEELFVSDFSISLLIATHSFIRDHEQIIKNLDIPCETVGQEELEKIGTFESNNAALAIVKQKPQPAFKENDQELVLVLDEIKDPGNLGAIIRIADWYGIKTIIASEDTVEFYNPKVITATKGSFLRVTVFYTNLKKFLSQATCPIYGAFLGGDNIHEVDFPAKGILVMGNESRGIHKEMNALISHKITIPKYGKAESLNVAMATAVILDAWKRNVK